MGQATLALLCIQAKSDTCTSFLDRCRQAQLSVHQCISSFFHSIAQLDSPRGPPSRDASSRSSAACSSCEPLIDQNKLEVSHAIVPYDAEHVMLSMIARLPGRHASQAFQSLHCRRRLDPCSVAVQRCQHQSPGMPSSSLDRLFLSLSHLAHRLGCPSPTPVLAADNLQRKWQFLSHHLPFAYGAALPSEKGLLGSGGRA